MNSCHGCGAIIQGDNPNKEGYVRNNDNKLCERCFRIKHYNDYQMLEKTNEDFLPIIDEISKTGDLVVLLVDLLNIPAYLEQFIDSFNNPILLVLTKRDLLPVSLYEERIISYFDNMPNKVVDIILVSSMKNYQMDELMDKINLYKTTSSVYVVGYTNAGKSSLINKILRNYTNVLPEITTSILPSTTIRNMCVEINEELTLIDTPGLLEEGSIINLVDEKTLKKIVPKKEIKPITYQIKDRQFILIDELAQLEILEKNDVTLYLSNELEINRMWKELDHSHFEKHIIDVQAKEDIVISGLCFVKVMTSAKAVVYTLPGVKVYTRPTLI